MEDRTAELLLGLIGGIFGILGAVFAVVVGQIGAAFSPGLESVTYLGISALFFAFLGLVGGAIVKSRAKAGGGLMLASAIGGLISVSLAYVPAFLFLLVGGVKAVLGSEEESTEESQEQHGTPQGPTPSGVPNFCPECGKELSEFGDEVPRYCPNCGRGLHDTESGEEVEPQETPAPQWPTSPTDDEPETAAEPADSEVGPAPLSDWYRYAAVLFAAALILFLVGVATIDMVSTASGGLLIFSGVSGVAAIVAMYMDLRELDRHLWDTRPVVWVIGAVLLWIVVLPVYLYKRRQASQQAGDAMEETDWVPAESSGTSSSADHWETAKLIVGAVIGLVLGLFFVWLLA